MLHPVPSALALALAAFLAAGPALADTATSAPATAPPSTSGDTEASNNFSIVRYRADYQVRPDAGNVQTETYEVLLKTKASVEQFSQVHIADGLVLPVSGILALVEKLGGVKEVV